MWLARFARFGMAVMLLCLAACSSTPVVDRPRIVDVPLAATQSDLEFSITRAARAYLLCADNADCSPGPVAGPRQFAREVRRLAVLLEKTVVKRYPDPAWCALRPSGECFDVYVVEGDEPGSASSANGRIALHAGLGRWQADDGVLAFVIAREMGHVIARHHEENSSVSIATSVLLNIFMPVSGVFRSIMSFGGARLAATSNRDVQAAEADAIAFNLLEAAGMRTTDVAHSLFFAAVSLDDDAWSREFKKSVRQFVATARATESASARAGPASDRRVLAADRNCSRNMAEVPC